MRAFRWRVRLRSPPDAVYAALASADGRRRFWAESAEERDGSIEFRFPSGATHSAKIIARAPPSRLVLRYFGALTAFEIAAAGQGAILALSVSEQPEADWAEAYAGWVSVLMNLKAAIDFGIDLRNHDPAASWDQGFVEN